MTIHPKAIIHESAFVDDNVSIGEDTRVTHDVPPHALVAGVPARRIGWVSRTGERLDETLVCPRTSEIYEEIDGALHLVEG